MLKNINTIVLQPLDTDRFMKRLLSSLFRPALISGIIYIVFLSSLTLIHHYTILHYVHIGRYFLPGKLNGYGGYDGQFYYQIARDPWQAFRFMDNAAYRYQRILYPLIVYVLSLGQSGPVPYLLLLVNFVSILCSVEIISRLLKRHGLSPWFSLAFGLYFGQAAALIFDTTEPLTYALICVGIWLIEEKRLSLAALCMGLAALSRETALLFPLGYTLFYLLQRRWQDVARFVILALLPLPIWYMILWRLFGQTGLAYAPTFEHIPFAGIFAFLSDHRRFWPLVVFMLIPTVGAWCYGIYAAVRRRWDPTLLIWIGHLLLVTMMAPASYAELISCGRLSTGLILATLLYAWQHKDTRLLKASQYYTLTFLLYAFGLLIVNMFPS